ncbi:MAG: hypothetical protein KAS92_00910 [Candidatus Omnitrophica bacterium]|nr:hypothetical protein [Candidatus Omnitrophota bacterium]
MDSLEVLEEKKRIDERSDVTSEMLRSQVLDYSKNFKTSWVKLGQVLYSIYRDKLYYAWGYDKFEYYTEQEIGLPKSLSLKLLKTYFFLETEEPAYLASDFSETRDAVQVPSYEAVNVLRMAKQKKELMRDDYVQLRKNVFDKGKDAAEVRKDLVAMMKERKPVDPEEERDKRNEAAIRKLYNALDSFKKDMEVLKLIPDNIIDEAKGLMSKLEGQF